MVLSKNNRVSKVAGLNFIETLFSITAFLLMWIGSMRCDFIQFTDTSGTSSDPPTLQFGIWRYLGYTIASNPDGTFIFESCHEYPDVQDIDPTWKAAEAFVILAFIMGVMVLVASCVFACSIDSDNFVNSSLLAPAIYLIMALFQGLSLLLLNSNACKNNIIVKQATEQSRWATFPETCSLNTGAKLIISATVFWFAAAVASFGARKVKREIDNANIEEKEGEAAKAKEGEDVEAAAAETEEKQEQAKA